MAIYIRKYNPIDNNGSCVFSGFLSGPKPIFGGFSRNLFIESIRPHFLPSLFAFLLYFQLSVSQIKFKKDESSRFPPGNITNWRSGYRFVNFLRRRDSDWVYWTAISAKASLTALKFRFHLIFRDWQNRLIWVHSEIFWRLKYRIRTRLVLLLKKETGYIIHTVVTYSSNKKAILRVNCQALEARNRD